METHRRKIAGRAIALALLAVTAPVFSVTAEAQTVWNERLTARMQQQQQQREQREQRQQQRQQRQQQAQKE